VKLRELYTIRVWRVVS